MEELEKDLENKQESGNKESLEVKQEPVKKKLFTVIFKVISQVFSILMVVLVVFILYTAISGKSEKGIAIGPFNMFNILTGSMRPSIEVGTLVVTMAVPQDELRIGDVITFLPKEDSPVLLTHRIVKHEEDSDLFVTRGDANNADDNPVYFDNIVGKVVFQIPLLGLIISLGSTPYGLALIVIIFALFIFLVEIAKRIIKS